ncbi:DUF4235 domain-containing protein [Luteipulveratus sp. YIM 133132]|uniref:DUF4235 domain-containing protein n=1 Tax=Luteipulveratus flavus TaxID=3031728 RepID=A0ABT6CBW4_9MICO|nr:MULTISPECIES: DUF4235 domain-containing protein [unclassified Luteipulveratus]MDE9364886.1 DUF4235 domain-containing protein [Luteipulveratus sp. YIM 133132]MDF8266400.1 DUF4235 domain-containing protein [Luteipulveratus sp. YIM 133296]
MGNALWKIVAIGSGLVAARAAKAATDGTWKAATGGPPPQNPADPDTGWKEAAAFALVSGAIMGIARTAAHKQAAKVWVRSTGHLPGPLQPDHKNASA